MRYLIDTNIFVYLSSEIQSLSLDVFAILGNPENLIYISTESIRELIIAYNNKKLLCNRWNSPEEMVKAIESEFYIKILPVKKEHMITYAQLETDITHDHKDPSDHVIISHAITERMPLISSDTRFNFYTRQGLEFIYNRK